MMTHPNQRQQNLHAPNWQEDRFTQPELPEEIRFVPHPDFEDPEAVHNILEELPECEPCCCDSSDSASIIQGTDYRLPNRDLLTPHCEQLLFMRMNLLRCLAARRLESLSQPASSAQEVRTIRNLLADADESRSQIIQANQRLVVSNAAKFIRSGVPMADLISEANVALMNAVDRFDVSRGFRLSTYATFAMFRHLNRFVQREQKRTALGGDEVEPLVDDSPPDWIDVHPQEQIAEILAALPIRERGIIAMRYGLHGDQRPRTLAEIGDEFGLSKERIRQLIRRACDRVHRLYAQKLGFE
jgi:RNA polymerase primary sigma factor